MHAHTDRCTH
uniref:Uncharacterized protein n=1 Tax=Arundo donax TaxID=35708 RepID=A0A0A9AQD4_ARUDO